MDRDQVVPALGEGAMALSKGMSIGLSACRGAMLLLALAGCSGVPGFGRPEDKPTDPNAYPAKYKADVMAYLQNHSTEVDGARDPFLSTPTLGQLAGTESRYFVCLRMDTPDGRKEKLIIFYGGEINQYVDASGRQCATAAYQPFPEVTAAVAQMRGKK
jgi:hypothetical protein